MTTTEKTKPTFTQEDIKQMRAGLLKLKPDTPARVSTNRPLLTKEAIMALAPTLIKMRDKGVSTARLVEFLATQELVIQPATLNRYLNSYQKEAKTTPAMPVPEKEADPVEAIGQSS